MYKLRLLLLSFVCMMLVSGCGGRSAPEARSSEPSTAPLRALTAGDPAAATAAGEQLAGGPESAGRSLKPEDNYVLQKKYPNVLALDGPPKDNRIAFTFDDGPDARFTPQVLDILKKHGVKATFFVMGSRVAGHPDIAKRIHEEGHLLANHTYWHPKLFKENIDRMKWEVKETDKQIQAVVGYSPKLFRSPYGGLNDELVKTLGELHYSVIGWTVDSLDWTQADSESVKNNVRSRLHPGSIVLFHSGGDWTQDLSGGIQALDELIPQLKEEGMQFVTVSRLLGIPDSK
ncbi:polysaccharide deacetylase family protein [Cohnella sp. GCM10027633]|uniref:polysaccharide deacetylase family protein n=1 Tax=unclassified Cohnella TaxID=2636738 RepID=UPI003642F903